MSTFFKNLEGYTFMRLTTYRKSGEAVPTTVWFAAEGDTLYLFSLGSAGKLKRIRHTSAVMVEPSTASGTVLGEAAEGLVRLLGTCKRIRPHFNN